MPDGMMANKTTKSISDRHVFKYSQLSMIMHDIAFVGLPMNIKIFTPEQIFAVTRNSVYARLTGVDENVTDISIDINRIAGTAQITYSRDVKASDSPECFAPGSKTPNHGYGCDPFVIVSKRGICQAAAPKF